MVMLIDPFRIMLVSNPQRMRDQENDEGLSILGISTT